MRMRCDEQGMERQMEPVFIEWKVEVTLLFEAQGVYR